MLIRGEKMKMLGLVLIVALALVFGCASQAAPEQPPAPQAPPASQGGNVGETPPAPPAEVPPAPRNGSTEAPPAPPGETPGNDTGTPPPPPAVQAITAAQLASHNTEGDCWVAYKGKV